MPESGLDCHVFSIATVGGQAAGGWAPVANSSKVGTAVPSQGDSGPQPRVCLPPSLSHSKGDWSLLSLASRAPVIWGARCSWVCGYVHVGCVCQCDGGVFRTAHAKVAGRMHEAGPPQVKVKYPLRLAMLQGHRRISTDKVPERRLYLAISTS